MNDSLNFPSPIRRRIARGAVALTAAALLLAATGCSSSDGSAAPSTSTTPLPTTTPPPTTTSPPTTIAATTTTSVADSTQRELISGILESHHAAGEFVGARIAVLDRDGTTTEVSDGTTTVDPASGPVDPDVAWNVGSVTKTFVAVVVLQLADEGKIDLDAGIDTFFPDVPGADRITPRELLQHTSGLAEYIEQPAVVNDDERPWTPAELIAVAEAAGPVGEPGAAYHYSNTNYIMLGEIIRQVTGNSWADEVRTRIVEPLGMTNTGVITDDPPTGYQFVDGSFVDATLGQDPSVGGSAGALESTGHDLLLFATALAHGALLSPASQAAMQTFIPGDDYSQFGIVHSYGLGLERYSNEAITVDGHMGTGQAQSAFLGFDTEHGTAVAVMTNTAIAGPQAIMAVETLMAVNGAG